MLTLALLLASAAQAGSFQYADLLRVLNDPSRSITSADDLLAQPELTKPYRAGFTAVFRSRSAQYADP